MDFLVEALKLITYKHAVMWLIGGALIFLAIRFKTEPALLLPIGFGCILVNIPLSNVLTQGGQTGIISWLYNVGIEASEAMPILLFIGIGAMIDFEPLIANPKLMFLGGFAQIGIFLTVILAVCFGFSLQDAAASGIIGAADGPTSILVAHALKSKYVGAITIVAYSYMALVPIIQPPVVRLLTTRRERLIRMDDVKPRKVSKVVKILFPIVITFTAGLIAPSSLALIGFLMLGNLIKESGVLGTLTDTAKNNLANLITLLLGVTIAFTMRAEEFLSVATLVIMALGLFAFVLDTAGGVLFAKFLNLFLKNKINPMIGAAGISAFPMSARVIHKMGLKEDNTNFLLMHAVGANVSGQIASAIVGGLIIGLVVPMI
ncbi:MAG: sodium ion-translocating decarboxylase subunit beta [Clostridiales bacterium]|jgi:oxaloacetate decarboxylase beta subunit|nr:sodium ion-translocating decarboxylase subunit beta [Clostridiales bacterium]